MRVDYKGADAQCKFRTALISYDESEERKMDQMCDAMYAEGYEISV